MGVEPFDDPDDPLDLEAGDDNETLRALRKRIDDQNKALKGWEKDKTRLAELEQTVAEQQTKARVSSATDLLPDEFKGLADVFAEKHEGDLTPEAAQAFLEARGLAKKQEPQQTEQQEPGTPPFQATTTGAGPAPTKVSRAEFDRLLESDPQQATELAIKDRVEWNNPDGIERSIAARQQR